MKDLMTRKIVLGMLMTLVLAFSVQGIAEAVDEPTFTQTEANIVTLRTPGSAATVGGLASLTLDDPARIESVKIVGSSGIIITAGSGVGESSVTYTEVDDDLTDTANGSIAGGDVAITFTSVGRKTVTISGTDNDSNGDGTLGDKKSWSFQYIYYVSEPATSRSTTVSFTGVGGNGYKYPYWPGVAEKVHSASGNYSVTYDPVASLDIHLSTTDKRYLTGTGDAVDGIVDLPSNGIVSSAFNVHLKTTLTATQTITATLGGTGVETKAVYINGSGGSPTLALSGVFSTNAAAKTSSGDPGANIADAITATITDGAGTGIPGILVRFDVRDRSHAGGTLVFPATTPAGDLVGSNNRALLDANGTAITSGADKTLYVQTAGTTGTATLNFLLGTAGEQEITVTAIGQTEKVSAFTAAATSGLRLIRDDIRQRGSVYDLYVRVEDDGSRVGTGYDVEFFTSQGDLTNTPDTGNNAATSTSVTEDTDPQGIAHVIYDPGARSGTLIVIARIRADASEGTPAGEFVDDLTLNVSGGTVTPPRQPDQPQQTPTDAITFNLGTSITGNTGDEVTLEARVRDRDGFPVPRVPVTFTISDSDVGSLSVSSGDTNSNGVVRTVLTLRDEDGTITATATGYDTAQADITIEPAASDLQVASGGGQTGTPGSTLSSPFVVRFEDTEGDPIVGARISFTVETGGGSLSNSTDTTDSEGEAETTLTLGTVGMRNTVRASVDSAAYPGISSITFTAEAARGPEAVVIAGGDRQIGQIGRLLDEDLSVQVVDGNDDGVSGILVRFRISEGRGRLSRNSARTDNNGYAEIGFTPTADGEAVVEAYSTGLSSAFFTINTGDPPADILKVSGDNQSGSPGSRLANPFVVEVIDENDDPVSDVTITFAVTAGGGSLSVTSVTTNGTGRAQTYLRLGDDIGENTVVASVSGLSDRVTFTARTGAEILVSAAQRPPMYWISRANGKLHRLVDDEVENLAPNIDNILSLTVDTQNQLLYWTRQTAQSKSAIQRSGLNGRGVITLQTSLTLMTSIAVDSTGTTLYWADILGKIKSRPVQGNRVTLLAQNLSSPTGLVWANNYLYWGEATGQIRRMNLRNNRRTIETITTGSGEPVSLAVQSGRVYWTEISGNAAQLNRVNTNGTGVEVLKTLVGSRRVWVDVDGSASKLYLTRASKLERRGLSGRSTVTLVSGLASPGSLVLGGELSAGPPVVSQPTQPPQPTQPTDNSKYDVNGDGTVDLLDVIAPLVQPNNMKNDVNGDGVVDIRDTQEIDANRDAAVAAPSLDIDVKALDINFDRVQEQIETLLASGDMSITTQRALLYLQHLLASARPDETVLLANYPNPFNPETWIPYHLAESTDVRVNIYDAQGVLVRVLPLGHQTAGYYTSRSRAAYWDGRNVIGERVASGIYFYQLQTDAVSPMRKMVILK